VSLITTGVNTNFIFCGGGNPRDFKEHIYSAVQRNHISPGLQVQNATPEYALLFSDCKPRDSGAKRKRFVRERKMRDGTWMETSRNKYPSSQEKCAEESSGGVKRPHSDSSTPSLEKQQSKTSGTLRCRLGRIRKLLLKRLRWSRG
jgi:hypothetical protein